jgi:uncharacterized radical SAM protein YgiQ
MGTGPASLFSHRKHWAHRFGPAPVLPMTRAEMNELGWDRCDVILVTGDAYVDHPSFGAALIGRLLEAQGFRVGILAQPPWQTVDPFRELGRPELFFGVTAGNMDSMVNRFTSEKKHRSDDAYSPGAKPDLRPNRCSIVYAQRCREAYPDVPIVVGGIEASLRRIAHYDYWSDQVRRSLLLDAKADILLYGNAERAVVDLAHRLARGESIDSIQDLRGTAFLRRGLPEGFVEVDSTTLDLLQIGKRPGKSVPRAQTVLRMPSYEAVKADPNLYAHGSRILHREANPHNARCLVQAHGDRDLWLNPPPFVLSSEEMDGVYELPYTRKPHPVYGGARIPAYEMIRFSVTIMRGCFGGCSFCSITEHEGRVIQNRSEDSVLREIETIRDNVPGFTGIISDIGGPTANMYRLGCKDPKIEAACRLPSCVYPGICENLNTNHSSLIGLYKKARELPGIKKVLVASGVRYDLAVESPEYVKELSQHHVGGYLKIAPEHVRPGPLAHMMKPGIGTYDKFKALFDKFTKQAGKEQYLIPYFIAAHPGTKDEDMLELALWLKRNGFRADQVQAFLPSPMATATAMYHSGKNPLKRIKKRGGDVVVAKDPETRRLHKAFLRYHDANNWPLLRQALKRMGRSDLIGSAKHQLIPLHQPAGTGGKPEGRRKKPTDGNGRDGKGDKGKTFRTTHTRRNGVHGG